MSHSSSPTGNHPQSETSNTSTSKKWKLLAQFSREAWGHPKRFVKRETFPGVGDIEYVDLGHYLPTLLRSFTGNSRLLPIIVRDEYRVALAALQGNAYRGGAFVTGQPGIGKTLFLVYLLVCFLGQKEAVALQLFYTDVRYAFFTEEGVSVHSEIEEEPIEEYLGRMWALCDSNQRTIDPSPLFSGYPDRMRIIQATSPNSSRWKDWSKHTAAWPYVMDIWSTEEVKKLAILTHMNADRMVDLAEKWGGIPRTIEKYYSETDDVVMSHFRSMVGRAVQECHAILQRGQEFDLPDTAPSSFYFIRPRSSKERRVPPHIVVPTRTLRCLLAEGLQREQQNIRAQFFTALCELAETRGSAGSIYESWLHSFFTQGNEIKCNWLLRGGETQNLPSTNNIIFTTQDPTSWTPPFYWIPNAKNFPDIDSALVLEDEIIAFQVTISEKHQSPPKRGFEKLLELLPENLKNHRWKLVFIGMEGNQIKSIAERWAGKIFFPTNEACVRVGWAMVDPVRDDVVFTYYRDEDDPSLEEPMQVE